MILDVRLIAAVGRSGQLGLKGRLPWHDPVDLRWFRENTLGDIVLMGGRTFDLVGELPGRERARWIGKLTPYASLRQIASRWPGKVIWIAGGAYTYAAFMPYVRRAVITRIDYDGEADSYMPPLWDDIGDRAIHNRKPTRAANRGSAVASPLSPMEGAASPVAGDRAKVPAKASALRRGRTFRPKRHP